MKMQAALDQLREKEAARLERLAWSVDDLCESLGVCRSFLYGEIRHGKLKAHKVGRSTRILEEDRLEYIKSWPPIQPSQAEPKAA